MGRVGFEDSEINEVFEIVAAILHVGNVNFKQDGNYGKIATPDIVKTAAQVSFSVAFYFLSHKQLADS